MERAVLPGGARLRWRAPVFALIGALLLAGALALGGGGALLVWGLSGLARWPLPALAVAALYLAPGLALLRLLWPRERALPLTAHLALALCFGAALPPLLLLMAQLAGLPWGAGATWAYLLVSVALSAWLGVRDWGSGRRLPISHSQSPISIEVADLALLGVSLAALLVRLYAVRDLRVGLLGDSYHHTMIVQLLVEHGGLFSSWEPYAPLATYTYHFGFHANAAFVHYVSGLDVPRSVVWAGQLLNAFAAPAIFALMICLGGSRWAGAWAALLAGLAGNIPAFYVNWGRYTQMAGQIVLVAAVACWVALAEATANDQRPTTNDQRLPPSSVVGRSSLVSSLSSFILHPSSFILRHWRLALLTALATAALFLTHYLVTALAGLFVLSYLVGLVLARRSWRLAGRLALSAVGAGALALLLAAPWLLNLLRGRLVRNAGGFVSGSTGHAVVAQLAALEPLVPKYVGGLTLLAALLGLAIACWRRDWRMALPAAWGALLVLAVVPYLVGLPGAGTIDTLTGMGTLYVPAVLLAGYALASAQGWLARSGASIRTTLRKKAEGISPRRLEDTKASASSLFMLRVTQRVPGALWQIFYRFSSGSTRDQESVAGNQRLPPSFVVRRSSLVGALAVLALIAANAGWQAQVVTGETALVTDADLAAIEWVRANTPAESRFLVNSFPAYGGTLIAGTDAGWWLPLLAGRQVNVPPLNYGGEQPERRGYVVGVNALAKKLRGRDLADAAPARIDLTRPVALKALKDNGFDYIYSGAHPYPAPDAADRFDTAKLRGHPAFRLVYDQGGVEIFQILKGNL